MYRSLKCSRITLHMNLFASFAANNLLWLLWYGVVLGDTQVIQRNDVSLPRGLFLSCPE